VVVDKSTAAVAVGCAATVARTRIPMGHAAGTFRSVAGLMSAATTMRVMVVRVSAASFLVTHARAIHRGSVGSRRHDRRFRGWRCPSNYSLRPKCGCVGRILRRGPEPAGAQLEVEAAMHLERRHCGWSCSWASTWRFRNVGTARTASCHSDRVGSARGLVGTIWQSAAFAGEQRDGPTAA